MKPVRIAVIGCGAISHVMHLPGIKTMVDMGKAELVAVADAIVEKAQAARDQYDAGAAYGDIDVMLNTVDCDLVVNLTPIPQHFAVSMAALRAGRHVYTQKPMATTVDEATTLIDEARRRGLVLGCAPEHPVRPLVQTMHRLIAEGAIGKVSFCRVQSSHDGPEKHHVPRDSTWFYKPGSNPILDLGVHGLSQITAIVGPIRRLTCFAGRHLPTRMTTAGPFTGKEIDVEIDDNSLLMLDFGDARFGFLDATYCLEASLAPRVEIFGSEGTLAVVGAGADMTLRIFRSSKKQWCDVEVPPAPPVRDLGVLHVVDHLREGGDLVLTGERGRHLVEVMTAATTAAATGCTVEMTTGF